MKHKILNRNRPVGKGQFDQFIGAGYIFRNVRWGAESLLESPEKENRSGEDNG